MNIYNPHNYLMHYGVKGQKWGIRQYQNSNGTWTEIGKERRRTGKRIISENVEYLPDYKGSLYFISDKPLSDTLMRPRIPNNYFTKNGYEDSSNPRICFSDTIDGCLAGLSQNVDGKEYYVYSPKDISSCEVYKPNNKAVPDVDITGELWVANPTVVEQVSKIKVTGNRGEDGKTFQYGNKSAELYDDWTYEEINHSDLMHYEVGTGYGPRQTSYASKYYDPVKAHEYYERTKQLKGRTRSASSLDDEGKQMWTYVKEQIAAEKQSKTESLKQELATSIAGIQAELTALRNLSGQERSRKKAEIQNRIKALRTQLASKKEQLQAELQAKQKETSDQKSSKSREIQNENRAITEYISATNKQASESVKIQNAQKSENVKSQKAAKQKEVTQLREKLKTTTDKEEKAKLREEIAKKSADKKEFSDKASAELANYKATNNASLAAFKESNTASGQAQRASNSEALRSFKEDKQAEMNEFRAANKADVKSATERTTSEISKLRDSLTKYNENSRTKTTEKTAELRSQIKALREANSANRKLLTEEYKNIQNDEFDKIAESHTKKKK